MSALQAAEQLISAVFERTGVKSVVSAARLHQVYRGTGLSEAEAWTQVHEDILRFLLDTSVAQCSFHTFEIPALIRVRETLDEEFSSFARFLPYVLALAEATLKPPPTVNPYGSNLRAWQGTEAALFRAYDGLKAVSVLLPHGLGVDCDLILRAVHEALLLLDHIHRKPSRAVKLYKKSILDQAELLYSFIERETKQYGNADPRLIKWYEGLRDDLAILGITVVNDYKDSRAVRGNVPKSWPKLQQMVDDKVLA